MNPIFQAAKEIWEQEEFKRNQRREYSRKYDAKKKKEGCVRKRNKAYKAYKATYYSLNKENRKAVRHKHYMNNKKRYIEKANQWRKENPERVLELKKQQRDSLTGSKHKLKRRLGFDPPQELLEAYHSTLVFKRARLAKKKQLELAS